MRWVAIAVCAAIALAAAATGPAGVTGTERQTNGRLLFSACDPYDIDGYCTLDVSDPTGTGRRTLLEGPESGQLLDAEWSPDGKRIAMTYDAGNRYFGHTIDVYLVNVGGDGFQRLWTEPKTARFSPSWSPDGTKIAFVQEISDIYIADADGANRRLLTAGFNPAWSADGTKIVFARGPRGGNTDLYLIAPDGSGLRRVTSGPASDDFPDWSAAGQSIVFERRRGNKASIYLIRGDGTRLRKLTRTRFDYEPAWSPDGRKIVFGRKGDIYVVNRDGTHVRRVTRTRRVAEVSPDWQPVRSN